MSGDLRVAALEDLLARVRRNAQEPRTSMTPVAASVAEHESSSDEGAGPLALDLDPLSDAFSDPLLQPLSPRASLPAVGVTVNRAARTETATSTSKDKPPSTRTPEVQPLEVQPMQRRATPPSSVRGVSPRPPTPMPPAMLPNRDSSPLHDAVISHTASSPASGRMENGFGLVPPPPRRPSSLPDFIDEPTATGDPDEAEQLLLAEQEEVRARVQFPTPPVPRFPTPLPPPPPLTLREPPRPSAARPVLELDDLDSSSVAPDSSTREPARPFGFDDHEQHDGHSRDGIPFATESQSQSESLASLSQLQPEVDSANTDRPPEGDPANELPPISRGRLPDIDAIERGLMSSSQDGAEPARTADNNGSDDSLFDAPRFEAPSFEAASFEDPATQDGPAKEASRPQFDVATVDVQSHEVEALANSDESYSPAHSSDIAPPARVSSFRPGREASSDESPPTDLELVASAQVDDERSPSSSRQIRDEVRPLDDRFDGFGPVGDSEPPPESGEVPSQRYGVGESPAAREPDGRDVPPSEPPRGAALFENPSTEDDARSGVVVARISSAPSAGEEMPSAAASVFPISNPSDGSPPKPARVIIAPTSRVEDAPFDGQATPAASSSRTTPIVPPPVVPEMVSQGRTLRGMAVPDAPSEEALFAPSDSDAMSDGVYDSQAFDSGSGASDRGARSALDDKTTEVQSIGRVDVFERNPVVASAPIAAVAGARADLESFGAIVDASIALGL